MTFEGATAREHKIEWPEPEELLRPQEAAKPYPVDALPAVVGDAVRYFHQHGQQPLSMIGASALANVSLAAQGLGNVARDRNLVGPLSLSFITVAESGERKSTVDRAFNLSPRAWETQRRDDMEPDICAARARVSAYEAERDGLLASIKKAANKGGGDIGALRERLEILEQSAPTVPIVPRLFYEDATQEALAQCMASGWPSASLWSDEAGLVVGSHAMSEEGVMRFLSLLNKFWDGGTFERHRTTQKSFTIRGRRLTTNLMMQGVVLARLFDCGGGVSRGTGFLARALVQFPESTIGTRLYREAEDDDEPMRRFHDRITALLDTPLPTTGDDLRLVPPIIEMSPAAKTAWVIYFDDVERQLIRFGDFADVKDFASKSAENAARIAGCFHVLEHGPGGEISDETIERGIALATWHLFEARRVVSASMMPAETRDALLLWDWLDSQGESEISPGKVLQYGPNRLRNKADRDAAISTLAEHNYLARVQIGNATVLRLNPKARDAA